MSAGPLPLQPHFVSYRMLFALEPALLRLYRRPPLSAAGKQRVDPQQQVGFGEGLGQAAAMRVVEELAH